MDRDAERACLPPACRPACLSGRQVGRQAGIPAAGRGHLTNKANSGAGKSAGSVAAGATCRAGGGRRLPKIDPFGGRGQDRSPSYCLVPGACLLPCCLLPVAWCPSSSRSSWRRTGKTLWNKDLRIWGCLRNVPFRSETFRNFPFRSALFRLVRGGSGVLRVAAWWRLAEDGEAVFPQGPLREVAAARALA